jgi:hypothetical protein
MGQRQNQGSKKTPAEWEKIFTNYISDKSLASIVHKIL